MFSFLDYNGSCNTVIIPKFTQPRELSIMPNSPGYYTVLGCNFKKWCSLGKFMYDFIVLGSLYCTMCPPITLPQAVRSSLPHSFEFVLHLSQNMRFLIYSLIFLELRGFFQYSTILHGFQFSAQK